MAVYKVVFRGVFQGQAINNILYYRNGIGVDIGGLTVGGTKEVADAAKFFVWTVLKGIVPTTYELQQIDSYAYDETTFDLLYQNPFTLGVGEVGTGSEGPFNGPGPCAIMKFILESHIVGTNGFFPPKRGYLAIGPLADSQINSDGSLNMGDGWGIKWNALCAVCANNIETVLPIPAVFYPIRVHMEKVGILLKLKMVSFSDIQAAIMRNFTSYRRSRMPEN